MSWSIRRIEAGDIDAVQALAGKTPEAPHWNFAEYERCIVSDSSVSLLRAGFVAEASGRQLGFSIGKLVAGVCELEAIVVLTEAQGQGIGHTLLEAVANWARANGAARWEIEVRSSNTRAIKLYEKSGLRREGLRPGYYPSPEEDAVLMGAALRPGGKLA